MLKLKKIELLINNDKIHTLPENHLIPTELPTE